MSPFPGGACPSPEEIAQFVERGLAGDGASRFEAHIADCDDCRQVFASGRARSGGDPRSEEGNPEGDGGLLESGSLIGRYRVVDLLGLGAMGYVYVAVDPELDRRVAIKVLRSEAPAEAEVLGSRLRREAKAMAKLSHPNVVTVYDVGTSGGRVFLAMELVEGSTLREWLAGVPRRSWREIVLAFIQAGRGLAAAHASGLVHRDFKPANVLVTGDGAVRVTDFGLVQEDALDPKGASVELAGSANVNDLLLTRSGAVIGTPGYMAPEQLDRQRAQPRSDVFSFCVALWESLYGERPFRAATLHECREAIRRGPTTPPATTEVPRAVRDALAVGLREDPEERYASMQPLLDRLVAIVSDRVAARRKVLLWVGAVALCAAATAGCAVLWKRQHTAAVRALCRAEGDLVSTAWNPASREAVRQAMLADQDAEARERTERTLARLDDYAAAWRSERSESCEATRLRRTQSEAGHANRSQCLDDARARLGFLSEFLASGERVYHLRALRGVGKLPVPKNCTATSPSRTGLALPADPALRARAIEARHEALRAEGLINAGKWAETEQLARRLIATAHEVGDRQLEARGEHLLGKGEEEKSRREAAILHYRSAIALAQSVGDDQLSGMDAARIAELLIIENPKSDDGLAWLAFARGSLDRLGNDVSLETTVLHLDAEVAMVGDPRAALALNTRALDLQRRSAGELQVEYCSDLNMQARIYDAMDQPEEGEAWFRKSVDCMRGATGSHWQTARMLYALAGEQLPMEKWAEALASSEQALAIMREDGETKDPLAAWCLFFEADALAHLGRHDAAESAARQAIDLASGDKWILASAHLVLGEVRAARSDGHGALAECTTARATFPSAPESDAVLDRSLSVCLGEAELLMCDVASARRHLEEAVGRLDAQGVSPYGEAAILRFAWAKAVAADGHRAGTAPDLERARRLAGRARDELLAVARAHPYRQARLDEVTRWLEGLEP